MIHAQLNANGICTGYGDLTNIETAPNIIFLPDGWNEDFLWRKYENGVWSTEKFLPPAPVPGMDVPGEIDSLKSAQADILLAMVMNNLM